MDQQELRSEVQKELDQRHEGYMEQYAAISEDLKNIRLDIHRELGQVSKNLSNCEDSFTRIQEANKDLYQEFKELRSDTYALLKQTQIPRTDAEPSSFPAKVGESSQTGSFGSFPALLEGQAQIRHRHGRINLSFPRFGKEDPTDWIFRAEAYFRYNNIPSADYVNIASFHLDKPASRWFQLFLREGQCHDWDAFKGALIERFGPSPCETPLVKLKKLMQTTSVSAYHDCFEDLACQISGFPPTILCSAYIYGLKPKIKAAFIARKVEKLSEAFYIARLFEEEQYKEDL